MSVTAHRTADSRVEAPRVPAQRAAPVEPVVDPVGAPRRRRVHGYVGPPRRRRVVGAPRVVARPSCEPPRRRVSFLTLVAVGASTCLAVVGLGMLAGAGSEVVPARTEVVRVQPGESLSELAARMAPSSDTGAVVERIRELNGGLEGGLQPGQPLWVPSEG